MVRVAMLSPRTIWIRNGRPNQVGEVVGSIAEQPGEEIISVHSNAGVKQFIEQGQHPRVCTENGN